MNKEYGPIQIMVKQIKWLENTMAGIPGFQGLASRVGKKIARTEPKQSTKAQVEGSIETGK